MDRDDTGLQGYCDYNASAPLRPAVRASMLAAFDLVGNPSSVHRWGRASRRAVDEARHQVAALVGVAPAQVIFTSGGTEANALAMAGTGGSCRVVSAIEHPSVLAAAPAALVAPVRADGVLCLEAFDRLLASCAPGPCLAAVMLVNNETGVVQPVADAARIAHRHGALLLTDAVQAAGRLALDCAALGVDMLTLSAHKIGGPKGAGALVVRDGLPLAALLRGGGQERRRRAGTENLPGLVGFGTAAAAAAGGLADMARLAALRDRLEAGVRQVAPDVRLFGADAPRVANTSCLAMPGVSSETQVMALDLAGVAVSAGAACSSGKVAPSHVLTAMGVAPDSAATAIRVSLGWASSADDIDRFLAAWTALYARTVHNRVRA